MTDHKTGTREEWLAARLGLLKEEKELTRRSDELARRRQELPWVRVDKEDRFDTDEGSASLADLFRGRSQLLVYHFMLGPEYTAGCPHRPALADGVRARRGSGPSHPLTGRPSGEGPRAGRFPRGSPAPRAGERNPSLGGPPPKNPSRFLKPPARVAARRRRTREHSPLPPDSD